MQYLPALVNEPNHIAFLGMRNDTEIVMNGQLRTYQGRIVRGCIAVFLIKEKVYTTCIFVQILRRRS